MYFMSSGSAWRRIFPIPTEVVDEHLLLASPTALKVLLLLLRHTDGPMSTEEIAERLRLSRQDVIDGALFWTERGIITPIEDDAFDTTNTTAIGQTVSINHPASLPIHSVSQSCTKEKTVIVPVNDNESTASMIEKSRTDLGRQILKKVQRPRIYAHDLPRLLSQNSQLAMLLQEAQRIAGRDFTALESECVLSLRLYFQFPVEVALMLVGCWCHEEKSTPRSLDLLAASWADQGVDTLEKATKHLEDRRKSQAWENAIHSAFRIEGRRLTSSERDFCARWLSLALPQALVVFACEQTVTKIGKVSFAYANKLLVSWREAGISTVEQAKVEIAENNRQYQLKKSAKTKNKSAKTSGSSLDNDELQAFLYQEYA